MITSTDWDVLFLYLSYNLGSRMETFSEIKLHMDMSGGGLDLYTLKSLCIYLSIISIIYLSILLYLYIYVSSIYISISIILKAKNGSKVYADQPSK